MVVAMATYDVIVSLLSDADVSFTLCLDILLTVLPLTVNTTCGLLAAAGTLSAVVTVVTSDVSDVTIS